MPCEITESDEAFYRKEMLEDLHNSPAAELLCKTMNSLSADIIHTLPLDVQKWWIIHRRRDQKKELIERKQARRESKKRALLSKLTREEKDLLGVNG